MTKHIDTETTITARLSNQEIIDIAKSLNMIPPDWTLFSVESAREFKTEIFHCLNRASNEKILSANQKEIRGLLKKGASSQINKKGYTEIMGGGKNFNRTQDIPHFKLHNGC